MSLLRSHAEVTPSSAIISEKIQWLDQDALFSSVEFSRIISDLFMQ